MPILQAEAPAIDAVWQEAVAHHQSGNLPAAERLYRHVLDVEPGNTAANHNLGILALQTRRPPLALPYLRTALDGNSHHAKYWLTYAEALIQAGQLHDAREALTEAQQRGLQSDAIRTLAVRLDVLCGVTGGRPVNWMPDHPGEFYIRVLERLHAVLLPKAYLEIGVETGATLALARCHSIGIDPKFQFADMQLIRQIIAKPSLLLYQMPSDDFFARCNPTELLGGPIDFAFLDGMHRCEYLLRDFLNTERHCRAESVIALHDCLPTEAAMAERDPDAPALDPRRQGMWTGDVWRTALLLKRRRPDLRIAALDAAPTGLILITNLDPNSTLGTEDHDSLVAEMLGWSLADLTLAHFYEQIDVEPEAYFRQPEQIQAWLRPGS